MSSIKLVFEAILPIPLFQAITGADDLLVKCWSMIDGRLVHTFRGASAEISDLVRLRLLTNVLNLSPV